MNPTITHPRPEQSTTRATPQATSRATRRRAAFWLLAFVFAATMLGTTLPTPLYVIYQARWHFAAGIVTLIFAVYAAGVLTALLLAGRSSDQAGASRCWP
jgi:MFS family permease